MANQEATLTLTIVRHGQTNANRGRILCGQHTDIALNETGLKQATLVGEALKEFHFDEAYASDLSRAQTTCKLILEQNKASSIKDFVVDPRIKERNFGVCENEPVSEFQNKVEKAGFNQWIDYVPENAENQEDIYNRCKNFLMDLIYKQEKISPSSILIATHGGVIREFLKILIDEMGSEVPPGKEPKENDVGFDRFGAIKNTSWSRFEVSLSGNDTLKALKCVNLLSNDHLDQEEICDYH